MIERASKSLLREIDPVHGGIGRAPKFPQPSILKLLWRAWRRNGEAAYRDAVLLSLHKMSQGGIYDHLGGGYARYSTDERWLVPHFEKMLYDNAQLLELLTLAAAESDDPLFAQRREETIDWILREMIAEGENGEASGAFAATLDADSEGEEGRFYVWQEDEIDRLLEPGTSDLFKTVYDVSRSGNWEDKNILNRTEHAAWRGAEEEALLSSARSQLFQERRKRIHPGWDDKVLADWNGMTIAALARAAFCANRPDWLSAAERAYAVILEKLDKQGRLHHSWRRGLLRSDGTLDDYAAMISAALTLHQFSGSHDYFDNATPAANGVLAFELARLFHMTGDRAYANLAEQTIAAFTGDVEKQFYAMPTLLTAAEFLSSGRQIICIGDAGTAPFETLLAPLRESPDLHDVIQILAPGSNLPEGHPAAGKGLVDGKPAVYICQQQTCSPPITDPATLQTALRG